MAVSSYDRASKLADRALKGFKSAHVTLNKSNEMLEMEAAARREEAEEWHRQVQLAIQQAEEQEAAAMALMERNQKTIAKLEELIGE